MAVFNLMGCKEKGTLPYQEADYTIANMDRQIEEHYDIRTIELAPDYSGPVRATLLRHDAPDTSRQAVLYIHGYGDYFFHDHVRQWYNEQGFNFYALDLRKHGRSLAPHQRACFAKDLSEYFEEISAAIEVIRQRDGNEQLFIQAHSTGGLTTALYADRGGEKDQIDALVLNSPFFAFKASGMEKRLMNMYASWSKWRPGVAIPVEFEGFYGQSIHQDYQGKWDYTLAWKPIQGHPLHGAWIRAINQGHQQLYQGLDLSIPILIMRSDKSATVTEMSDIVFESDIVLDVQDMANYSAQLGTDVEVVTINNAVHDIFLSKAPVRQAAFEALGDWLIDLK
ncbi:MAG TPA: alpha/beta hydrolase [Saprospiraceae bacterium]|nr:alpha/beta hydrolase [Saprospiraceae bacterium]